MGDSGALLLGFLLAGISVEGLLKTASLVSLLLPLAVLAVPIVDTSFVVAKRLKHRVPVYEPDRSHLHHRFLNIGYSQPRAVLTIYAWCATLAAAALATRFIQPHPHGDWRVWAVALDALIGLAALAASIYIVYLLEIVKLANPIMRRREQLARERKTA
jgi:UDP-GlcNAc:undecaprenyl-phosphate GlcNAc-1-phosphate transferase